MTANSREHFCCHCYAKGKTVCLGCKEVMMVEDKEGNRVLQSVHNENCDWICRHELLSTVILVSAMIILFVFYKP